MATGNQRLSWQVIQRSSEATDDGREWHNKALERTRGKIQRSGSSMVASRSTPAFCMKIARNLLAAFLRRYRHKTQWQFFCSITVEHLIVQIGLVLMLLVVLLLLFGSLIALGALDTDQLFEDFAERQLGPGSDIPHRLDSNPLIVWKAVVLGPLLETLIFQSLPIGICRLLHFRAGVQMTASIALFFLAHLLQGVGSGICAGLVGGFYLAFTYIRWRHRSWWTAFWVTCASHVIHNGIVLITIIGSLLALPE
jgi:hypothetical protein